MYSLSKEICYIEIRFSKQQNLNEADNANDNLHPKFSAWISVEVKRTNILTG